VGEKIREKRGVGKEILRLVGPKLAFFASNSGTIWGGEEKKVTKGWGSWSWATKKRLPNIAAGASSCSKRKIRGPVLRGGGQRGGVKKNA